MNNQPKRRKSKDNPYSLIVNDEKKEFYVSFKDAINICHIIKINEKLYQQFNQFELDDLSIMNEYDNHIEHSELYESTLNKRVIDKPALIDEVVENKINYEKLNECIELLPEIQKRRLKKYFFESKTFEQIANEENCTKRAIKFSVDIAVKKISKNFYN
ncbi:MAG: sigma-70 family RNA polymerase sigma factor [Bacilli bacterium]|nr:sigma-70 family RNA polymerase sigma factor [Bacilli bacterium]